MRILYDGQIYSSQTVGGINRYFNNLINNLPESFHPYLTTSQSQPISYPNQANLRILRYRRFSFRPGRLSYCIEPYYFRGCSTLVKPHVIHPTYYSLLLRHEFKKCRVPIVLTVWDMIHELFSDQMDVSGRQAAEKQAAILASQRIICISENTKQDLLEYYKLPSEQVIVTYLASQIDIFMSYGDEDTPSRPYYLYVGGRASYKNFDVLLVAFAKFVSIYPETALCVVGSLFNDDEHERIAELKLTEHIEHYNLVNDFHLAKLYRCSLAFVYPSLYEGFGIPPLEAMSCGTPVVASNRSSIPEVVGNAGLLFNPTSVDELVDMLILLYNEPAKRERWIEKGYQQARLFDWKKTASQTVDVYRSLL